MTAFTFILALWAVAMLVVTYIFCATAREFSTVPEMEALPLESRPMVRD